MNSKSQLPDVEFSRPYHVEKLPPQGQTLQLDASAEELAALARRLDVVTLEHLHAQLTLSPRAKGRVAVEGTLEAAVVQTCVVSLLPVHSKISAEISRLYAPPGDHLFENTAENEESAHGLDSPDPPDPINHGEIDLGEAVAEQLILEIDPFPRKKDIDFQSDRGDVAGLDNETGTAEAPDGPFAVLSSLKKNMKE